MADHVCHQVEYPTADGQRTPWRADMLHTVHRARGADADAWGDSGSTSTYTRQFLNCMAY